MLDCTDARDLLGLYFEGDLEGDQEQSVREHLERCAECGEILSTIAEISDIGAGLLDLEAPEELADDLSASPCRRWLGLLFQAVDRTISQPNLERLLTHLESCPSCRRTWQDLTLIHQVGEAMEPPAQLLNRCIAAREPRSRRPPVMGRRMATAAAYLLAVLTSLVIGNPVTLARNQASTTVVRVAEVVSTEVSEVAKDGRGEIRIMLWRAWTWSQHKVEQVRDLVDKVTSNNSAPEQGEDT
ncbi:MAG: zf-HC2 domain-containing protein [Thermoanaerobaculales bacterium]